MLWVQVEDTNDMVLEDAVSEMLVLANHLHAGVRMHFGRYLLSIAPGGDPDKVMARYIDWLRNS